MRAILRLFLFIFIILPQATAQPDYFFKAFPRPEGLFRYKVRHLLQDQYGFIWLGTDDGLQRFDGQEYVTFRYDANDPHSLSGNVITFLHLDKQQQLWIGTDSGLNRLDRKNGHFERIEIEPQRDEVVSLQIKSLLEDSRGDLWMGTYSGLYQLIGQEGRPSFKTESFTSHIREDNASDRPEVLFLYEDDFGYLWVLYPEIIDRIHLESRNIQHFTFADPGTSEPLEFYSAAIDKKGHMVVSALADSQQLLYIDPADAAPQLQPYLKEGVLPEVSMIPRESPLLFDSRGQLWVGTSDGIYLLDPSRTSYRHLKHNLDKPGTLSHPNIGALYEGNDGTIWVGTKAGGINQGKIISDYYRFYSNDPSDPNSISWGQVRTITEDQDGHIWVGHLTTGIEEFALDDQQRLVKLQSLQHDPSRKNTLLGNDIIQIFTDRKGFLWIATNGSGLNRLDPRTGALEAFLHDPDDPNTISGNRIWGICEDKNGYIWVSDFFEGLNRIDPVTKAVKRFKHEADNPNSLSINRIKTLYVDTEGYLWIGTNFGLNRFDTQTETFTRFFHDPDDPASLSNSYVFSILEDRNRNLWVGTSLGLNRLRPAGGPGEDARYEIDRFYEGDGLPSNNIYSIEEDQQGNIWAGTTKGLARLLFTEPKNSFATVNNGDGLENAIYLPKAHYFHKETGWLYFGNSKGMLAIHPDWFEQYSHESRLILSSVTRTRKKEAEPVINYFIDGKQNLDLSHHDRILTFDLSDFNWNKARYYEFQLNGFNDQWRKLDDDLEITFTDLKPGVYTLLARSRDIDHQPMAPVHLLSIHVSPPWWSSGWAYGIYLLAAGGLLFRLYRFQLHRQLEKRETENLRSLNDHKNRIYTDITHEFKTPLTVISGMADQISGQGKVKKLIKDNSASLINLVNQILDLRRLETGNLKLEPVQADVVLFLKSVISSYDALAGLKGVQLHFLSKERELFMDVDQEKLLRIVSNLLSNAVKFTPKGGHVYVELQSSFSESPAGPKQEMLELRVTDTGVGIPESEQAHIFDRYYRAAAQPAYPNGEAAGGTGIGLALTKELTTLMGGKIDLESRVGEGATFSLHLPITRLEPIAEIREPYKMDLEIPALGSVATGARSAPVKVEKPAGNNEQPSLLIIEDNPDLIDYLSSLLEDHYALLVARNGQEGLDLALERIPDLIISDVMMPIKDGFEVCNTLKQDERTSHIPIVLLTAKTSEESRIQGYELGADAYLDKPFNPKELFVRLKKLNELRQRLRARYQNLEPSSPPADDPGFQLEDAFMNRLRQTVEKKMGDPLFNTTQLCKTIGMSRSHLHLKVKALTNMSTSGFINAVRLQRAKELLQNADLNVNQVAYEVGYKDPSYFSRKFTETFEMTPRQVIQARTDPF